MFENELVYFKSRMVAKRYSQKRGIDYDEIILHVVRHILILVVLGLLTNWDLHLEKKDINISFFFR